MTDFATRVQSELAAAVVDREYHELRDSFTVERADDGSIVAHTTLELEEPPDLMDEAREFDWEANKEDVQVSLPDDLAADADSVLSALSERVSVSDEVTIDRGPRILLFNADAGPSVILDFLIELETIPIEFERLAEQVVAEGKAGVEESSDITSVAVDGPLYDPTESDEEFEVTPDYTILHETDTPHERWGDCETLEDYAEMVADNNEEYTVEDVLDWDTYTCHFHLSGDVAPNELVREMTNTVLDANVSTDGDIVEVSPSRIRATIADGEELTLRGSAACYFEDLAHLVLQGE